MKWVSLASGIFHGGFLRLRLTLPAPLRARALVADAWVRVSKIERAFKSGMKKGTWHGCKISRTKTHDHQMGVSIFEGTLF